MTDPAHLQADNPVSLREAFWTWCRVALQSFGGPAGQIAVMHRIIVDEKRWVDESRFLHALNYCMLLPGPEAQQLASYLGWLLHRKRGALMAGILFILPGIVCILALSIIYASYKQTPLLTGVMFGLKAAVVAIVVEAVIRIGKRVLKNGTMQAIAVASFVAIFFGNAPFPAVVAVAALIGLVGGRFAPQQFLVIKGHGDAEPVQESVRFAHVSERTVAGSLAILAIGLALWIAPIALAYWLFGQSSILVQLGRFFSQAAVVTFGGAYAVLAYVAQRAVDHYGWLKPGEMLDGLGMAETTPGPLIMVLQFVGYMGAYRNPGSLSPHMAGVVGSLVTTWVTFVPSILWILLGAPYVERLRGVRALNCALSSITAAVVGVVMNLAVWFAIHTWFAMVGQRHAFGLRFLVPRWETLSIAAAALTALACLLTFVWKRGMATTLAVCAALGVILHFARLS